MCRQCDQFEPAVADEAIRGNSFLPLSSQIGIAKVAARLRRIPIEDENASRYQCTACSRIFRMTGDFSTPTGWCVENSP